MAWIFNETVQNFEGVNCYLCFGRDFRFRFCRQNILAVSDGIRSFMAKIVIELNVQGSLRLKDIPIYIQQDATLHSLFVSGNCSTCFGWYLHPSSGAHTTVSTVSGTCARCCILLDIYLNIHWTCDFLLSFQSFTCIQIKWVIVEITTEDGNCRNFLLKF